MKEVFAHNRPDKVLLIDPPADSLVLVPGEYAIVRFEDVEDVRADPTTLDSLKFGTVTLTNLRLAWNSRGDPNGHSLSIGLSTITKISVGNLYGGKKNGVSSQEGGALLDKGLFITGDRSVVLHASFNQIGYKFELKPGTKEFVQQKSNFFNILQTIYRAHDTTRAYRRVRVRSSVVRDGQPILLSREIVLDSIRNVGLMSAIGVSNVLGTLVRTSHRIIWFSPSNESYNVGIPYLDVLGLSIKEIKGSEEKFLVFSVPMNDNMKEFVSPYQELDKKTLKAKEHKNKGITAYSAATFAFDLAKASPSISIQQLSKSILMAIQKAHVHPDYGIEIKPQGDSDNSSVLAPNGQGMCIFGSQTEENSSKTGSSHPSSKDDERALKIIQAVVSRTNFTAQYIVSNSNLRAAENNGNEEDASDDSGQLAITVDSVLDVAFQSTPGIHSIEDLYKL